MCANAARWPSGAAGTGRFRHADLLEIPMKPALFASAAILALAFAAPAAVAQPVPNGGLSAEDVAAWLQNAGYAAKIETERSGRKTIASSAEGLDFHISMYDCHNGPRCASLEFFIGFDTKGAFNATQMNEWNRDNRWVRAYVDKANDPWLEMDVDLSPGGTYEGLTDQFAIWRSELPDFKKFIHW
jgi:Putative bacterial sensory transduction regulator